MSYKRNIIVGIAQLAPKFWARQVRRPIFILGVARSGTSLLADLIGSHPQVAHWSEANIIWDPTGHPARHGMAPDWVEPYVYNDRWWREHRSRQDEIPATFGVFQTIKMKPYFLNKSPYNTFRIPHILQMFPQARFIHIARHGLAVIHSRLHKAPNFIKNMPLSFNNDDTVYDFDAVVLRSARLWRLGIEEVTQQDKEFSLSEQGKIHYLTYEELCLEPERMIEDVRKFIGLDHPITLGRSIDNRNYKWHDTFSASTSLLDQTVAEMEPTFSKMGYSIRTYADRGF